MRYTRTIISPAFNANQLNQELQKIQTAIADTLSRKGDVPNEMEADLDMNSNRILNLPNPVEFGEPITLGFVLDTGGSGLPFVQTIQPGDGIAVDNADPQNPVISVTDKGIETITGGSNVTVDDTDPANVIISADGFVESVNAGTQISVDNLDPQNPVISLDAQFVETVNQGTGISVNNTDPFNPIINNSGVLQVFPGTNISLSGASNVPQVSLKTPLDPTIKIRETGTVKNLLAAYNQTNGGLSVYIENDGRVQFRKADGSGNPGDVYVNMAPDGPVTLYYDAAVKLTTQPGGVAVTGDINADSASIDGDATISGNLTVTGTINNPQVTSTLKTQDDGVQVVADTQTLNFAGAGVVVTTTGPNTAKITISGFDPGGGGVVTSVNGFDGAVVLDYADFAGADNITLQNDVRVEGEDTGGTGRGLLRVDASDITRIGNTTLSTILQSATTPQVFYGGNTYDIIDSGGSTGFTAQVTNSGGNFYCTADTQFGFDFDRPAASHASAIVRNSAGGMEMRVASNGNCQLWQTSATAAAQDPIFNAIKDAQTILYYNGSDRFNTSAIGIDVTGSVTAEGASEFGFKYTRDNLASGSKIGVFNSLGGVAIEQNGSAGDLYILQTNSTGTTEGVYLRGIRNGGVQLRYDNNSKLETTATGIDVTGSIDATNVFLNERLIVYQNDGSGSILRHYSTSDSDITALVPGTTAGTILEGRSSSHVNIGIRGNDSNDSFNVLDTGNGTLGPYARKIFSVTGTTTRIYYDGTEVLNTRVDGINVSGSVYSTFYNVNTSGGGIQMTAGNVNSLLDIDFPEVSTAAATVRFMRDTNTTGSREIHYYKGDGTSARAGTMNLASGQMNWGGKLVLDSSAYNDHLHLNRSNESWQFAPSTDGSLDISRPSGTSVARVDLSSELAITGKTTITDNGEALRLQTTVDTSCFIGFYENGDQSTRSGYVGCGSSTLGRMYIVSDRENIQLTSAGGQIICTDNVNITSGGLTVAGDIDCSGDATFAGQQVDIDYTGAGGSRFTARNSEGGIALRTDAGQGQIYQVSSTSSLQDIWIQCIANSEVRLRYNNSEKLNTNSGGVTVTGQCTATTFNATSARKYKKNIIPLPHDAMKLLDQIEPVQYEWKQDPSLWNKDDDEDYPRDRKINDTGVHFGFIADDVEDFLPEVVDYNEEGEVESMRYTEMIALLWKQNQELKRRVEELEAKVA